MTLILSLSKINLVGQPSPTGATLDIPFANQKNLNDIVSGSSLITFTRASTATFVGSNGLIQTAAVNAPRFDHNPTTGESLGLLVEESRTNLLLSSEEFDNASWTKGALTTTPNTTTAPNGTITADSVIPNTTTDVFYIQQNVTTTALTIYTWSVYVKANGFSWVFLDAFDVSNHRTWFDIANGVVGTVEAGNTSTITSVGNGWYRCTLTRLSAGGLVSYAVALVSGNNALFGTGNSTNCVYAWGAQVEAGAFPTSYIPTTTAAVTRSADVASITGANFTSWYNSTEGTISFQGNTASASNFFSIDDTTTNNRLTSYMASTTAPYFLVATGGTTVCNITSSAITANATFKQASAYKANDFAISTNGGTVSTDTSGALPTVNRMIIGANVTGGSSVNGTIRRLAYYPRRLSNTELQLITS